MNAEEFTRDAKARAAVAMHAGDGLTAAECLRRAIAHGDSDAETWLQLATAYRRMADLPQALDAAKTAVRLEPRNLLALLMLASLHEAVGSIDLAIRIYREAIHHVPAGTRLPAVIARQIDHARQRVADSDTWFKSAFEWRKGTLENLLTADEKAHIEGLRDNILRNFEAGPDVASDFSIPGIVSEEFFDSGIFAGVDPAARFIDLMLREFLRLVEAEELPIFSEPAMRESEDASRGRWSMIPLIAGGQTNDRFARHCPETMRLFETVDSPNIGSISPSLYFSVLEPRTKIPPHRGISNARLIVHWPLVVPPSCGIRVGSETRHWRVGEPLVFDDMIEHEAWNDSDEVRVVLISDVWRPELTEIERIAVTRMMALAPTVDD